MADCEDAQIWFSSCSYGSISLNSHEYDVVWEDRKRFDKNNEQNRLDINYLIPLKNLLILYMVFNLGMSHIYIIYIFFVVDNIYTYLIVIYIVLFHHKLLPFEL